jgi:hypothetical protein
MYSYLQSPERHLVLTYAALYHNQGDENQNALDEANQWVPDVVDDKPKR